MADLPNLTIGTAVGHLPDWRHFEFEDDGADDDDELAKTPRDVIAILGFDPLHEEGTQDRARAMDKAINEHVRPAIDAGIELLAFDFESARTLDVDGRLHVKVSNISKANVCPYVGREIPNGEELGLEPDRIYMLLRDPEELAKAVPTFNGLPLLSKHVPVNARDSHPELVEGSLGTEAEFTDPYLRNSLVIWRAEAIQGIESRQKCELSSAYHYRAVMEPGTYQGERFDGRMVDIVGNHVALVETGRAGPDVVVGDSFPTEINEMSKSKAPTRMQMLARGALLVSVVPKLAADSKLDIAKLTDGVTAKNWKAKHPQILAAIKPKLAQDANIDDVVKIIDALTKESESMGDDDAVDPTMTDPNAAAVDADPVEGILGKLRGKLTDGDLADVEQAIRAACKPAAMDEEDEKAKKEKEMKPEVTKQAMDAAIKAAVDAAVPTAVAQAKAETLKQAREAREAEAVVRPYVGDLAIAQDSAEGVYRLALETLGVKTEGIHPSAFRAILEAQPKPGEQHRHVALAQDSAPGGEFQKAFGAALSVRTI